MSIAGNLLRLIGILIATGPILVFLFMAAFPSAFHQNTILAWHYISAFGIIVYVPVGVGTYFLGRYIHRKSLPATEAPLADNTLNGDARTRSRR
jgi:hypothetical protein